MSQIQSSLNRVKRRVLLSRVLNGLGWAVLGGLVASSMLVVADKLTPMTHIPAWLHGVAAGVGLVLAVVLALGKLPSDADAAVLLDDRLGLKDKLGTAMYTATLKEQNELTAQVAREADEAAAKARAMVGQAAPIPLAKVWHWTPVAAALLLGVLFLMPDADPLRQVAKAEAEAKEQQLAEKGQEVIINTIEPDLGQQDEQDSDDKVSSGLPEELQDQLVSISDEIRKDPRMAQEKLKEAESLVSDAEDRLGDQADVIEAAFNPLQNDATALDAGQQGPADEFTRAMNAGDFEKAKQAIEELQKQIANGDMDQQTQQQLQQQLSNLANQLQQQANQAQQRQQRMQQQAQQQMQQQLQNSGMSASQAQQLSQQMAQQMQQQQQGQQGQQQGQQQQAQGQQQVGQQGQQGQGQQQSQQQMQQQLQQALQQQGMSQQQAAQQAQQMMQQMQQQMQQAQGQCQSGQMQQQLSQGLQQMAGQCNNPGGQQGQQAGQQGQGQGGQSAQQAINQMAQMQQQLQRMQQQQAQMQQAMNQLNQMQQGGGQNPGGGQGGQLGGTGDGGNPYGAMQPGYQHSSYAANDIQQGEGRVIASWTENGEVAPGEATVQFNTARTDAVQAAERAVTEDRVPRRYHESIKDYFQQLPEDPNAGRAPAAPR